VLCPAVGLGRGPVGGHPIGPSPRCHDLGHPLYRLGDQRGLSGLCHPGGLDRPGGHSQTCLAAGVVAHAAPGPPGGAPIVDGPRAGRPGPVCPLAVSAHHAAGVAPVFAHQYRWDLSAQGPRARSVPEELGPRARYGLAGNRHRLQRPSPPAALHPAGLLGGGVQRSLVDSDRSAARDQYGLLVWVAGVD
jgi:hypothetical protein